MTKNNKAGQKRSNAKFRTIEKKYGKDLGAKSSKKIEAMFKDMGYVSMVKLLKGERCKQI